MKTLSVCFLFLALYPWPASGDWRAIGPYGGDARSLAADSSDFSHLYLGTSNSQIYASTDGGRTWQHLSELAPRPDLVVDDLLVDPTDPNRLYAGAWGTELGGGVYRSTDRGRSWTGLPGMAGQSVRALVMAPRDPALLVAGTLEGVFQSRDSGATWKRISPENHPEIRNVESLALDEEDPAVIYAGTWHLPWKTVDGGRSWFSIKTGILEDSDIFSITVDRTNPRTVYLSACSGIYRSDSGGRLWSRIQGMPSTARRTRVIRQDPRDAAVVYAGTTEGLWKTESGGASWRRLTPANVIVNDILIDPAGPQHLFLATDHAGVLESRDGGRTFLASTQGFSHRQVSRLLFDPQSGRLLAAVLHDKEHGGVFANHGGAGASPSEWEQWNLGLQGRDVLSLVRTRDGELLAGTPDGLFRFNPAERLWERTGRWLKAVTLPSGGMAYRGFPLTPAIHDLHQAAEKAGGSRPAPLYAATSAGVLGSPDGGRTWDSISPSWRVYRLASADGLLLAATSSALLISRNGGKEWIPTSLPEEVGPIKAVAVAGKTIYAATERGLFRSPDTGQTWEHKGQGVPFGPVSDVLVDPADPRQIYVAAASNNTVFHSRDAGRTYHALQQDGFAGRQPRTLALSSEGVLHVASSYDGTFVSVVDRPEVQKAVSSRQ